MGYDGLLYLSPIRDNVDESLEIALKFSSKKT
jgi:hypothetical protein